MYLLPAIDLQNGQCVRLAQGDFKSATIYEPDPLKQSAAFAAAGATWLHIVDLDGARVGEIQQLDLIHEIVTQTKLNVQVGGGIRNEAQIDRLMHAGVARVVIGSLAVHNPNLVGAWLEIFGPDKIVVALDIRMRSANMPEVLTHGWQKGASVTIWDVINAYKNTSLKHMLCTDVERDGMLGGANAELYSKIRQMWINGEVQASGGINTLDDLRGLKALGLSGAIIGKALYEGHIDLAEAVREIEGA